MIRTDALKALAARIWADLPGDTPDKAATLKALKAALHEHRDTALAEHRRAARVRATYPLRCSTEQMLEKLVGQPPSKAHTFRVPILGINTPVIDVFRIAALPDHPLQPACQAFLDEHRLRLVPGPDKRGRKHLVIAQAPAPSPTPADVLKGIHEKIGGMLERRETGTAASTAKTNHTSDYLKWATSNAATMTDFSGGKVSTIAVERGDGQ